MEIKKLTYSVIEAAEALGVSTASVYKYARRQGFPAFKANGRVLISIDGLARWVQQQAQGGISLEEGEE